MPHCPVAKSARPLGSTTRPLIVPSSNPFYSATWDRRVFYSRFPGGCSDDKSQTSAMASNKFTLLGLEFPGLARAEPRTTLVETLYKCTIMIQASQQSSFALNTIKSTRNKRINFGVNVTLYAPVKQSFGQMLPHMSCAMIWSSASSEAKPSEDLLFFFCNNLLHRIKCSYFSHYFSFC